MAQTLSTDFPIDPVTTSGDELADILNRMASSIDTTNAGATPPPDLSPGMLWLDTSTGTNGILRMRNAANSGWIVIANTDDPPLSASAAVKKAGDTMTGPLGLADGTKTAPALAFASEPGLGWYRSGAAQIMLAQGGASIWAITTSGNNTFAAQFAKGVGGQSIVSVNNAPQGSANFNQMDFVVNADGTCGINAVKAGTATDKALSLNFPAGVKINGNAGGGSTAPTLTLVDATGAVLKFSSGSGGNKHLRCFGSNNFEIVNSAFSAAIFTVTDAGQVQCPQGYQVRNGANGASGVNNFNIGFVSQAHLFIDATDFGQIGAAPSDERIKKDIAPLALNETAFMGIKPIEYAWRDVRVWKDDGVRRWGWSAQNIKATMQGGATYGDEVPIPEDDAATWGPVCVDDRPILALTVVHVQDLISRVKALEGKA